VTDDSREARGRPAVLPTVLVALACFGVTFEFLALQLQSGRDPALGRLSASSAPAKVRPRRKIIITKVISAGSGPVSQTSSSSGAPLSGAPAPVASSTS
jgi:hypothetical protein